MRVQDARFQELLMTYQNTVLKAQQEVEDALAAFLQAQKRAGFLAESTESAQSSLDLAVLQYREGITDFTTVLTAQQALLTEQDSLADTLGIFPGTWWEFTGPWAAAGKSGRDRILCRTR